LWPDSLVPKPKDWGPHIELANFIPFEEAHTYEPPQALLDFLAAGEAPIYVGFGSVVAEDPAALTRTIFASLHKAEARGIVSEGWAHLGGAALPPNVYVIGDCPHDWLFPRCRAVCHHRGGGGNAPGVVRNPIPLPRLNIESLTAAFDPCRRPQIRVRASELGARLRATDGVELAVQSIERHLPAPAMCCSNNPDHVAVIFCDTCGVRL